MLEGFSHNLRSNSFVISVAAHLLKDSLGTSDQEEYQEMLSRNLANAQALLDSLINCSWLETDQQTSQIKGAITVLFVLLNDTRTDLVGVVSTDVQVQIDQLLLQAESLVS